MNEAIEKILADAQAAAAEYAKNYPCQPEYKAAIEAQHYAHLINTAIHEIKERATAHRNELYRSPN